LQDGKRVKTVENDRLANQISSESASYYILEYDIASNSNLKEASKRSRLIEVLLGMAMPSRCNITHDVSFFDDSLNDSQKAAVRFALESVEVACIHGPPGETIL
jgi:DNA polymerase alpha-associated DNA helicase A